MFDDATRGPKDFRDGRSDFWLFRICDLSHSGRKSSTYPQIDHCCGAWVSSWQISLTDAAAQHVTTREVLVAIV